MQLLFSPSLQGQGTPVREGETIEGSRRGVPYHAESTLSSAQVLKGQAQGWSTAFWHQATPSTRQSPPSQ